MAITDTPNTLTTEQARKIAHEHGHQTFISEEGTLLASVEWSIIEGDSVLTSGVSYEPLPLSTRALYEWLGY